MRPLLLLALLSPAWAAPARPPLASPPVQVTAETRSLLVKWTDPTRARATASGDLNVAQSAQVRAIASALTRFNPTFSPWIDLSAQRVDDLQRRAAERSGRAQPDLLGLHRVVPADPDQLDALADALAALAQVEWVYALGPPPEPPADRPPDTPDLVPRQGWLDPGAGIDAWAAWSEGLDGSGVRLADCEYGWHRNHEDLVAATWIEEPGQTPRAQVASNGWDHHGTAVAGQLIGQHNAYGIHGLAPAALFATYPEWTVESGYRRGSSIANAIADSAPGDIVLLEMQTGGPDGRYAPAEVNPGVFTLVRTGADAGVIVVGAAGNGSANLDGAAYETYRSWGDSGAILVGAGTSDGSRRRMGFSTYGERVDVQGWGQSVFTTGYGTFARYGGDVLQSYTHRFSGTSSASPFVAGSAALLQQAALRYRVEPLDPTEMRELLRRTGRPAAEGAQIGPLPDLAAAVDDIAERFDVLPTIHRVIGPDSADEGESVTLSVDGTILPTQVPRVVWTVVGTEIESDTLAIPTVDEGMIGGTVALYDAWGRFDVAAFAIEVHNVPPSLGPIQVQGDRTEGSELRLMAALSDPGRLDTHTWRWTIDGEVVSDRPSARWTPVQDGTYTVQVTATDNGGDTAPPRTATIEIADVPAQLTLDTPAATERKTPTELAVRIDDPGADTHEITWIFDGGTTERTGERVRHEWTDLGRQTFRVRAVDQSGETTEMEGAITVERRGCGCASVVPPHGLAVFMGLLFLIGWRRRAVPSIPRA